MTMIKDRGYEQEIDKAKDNLSDFQERGIDAIAFW